MKKEIVGVFSHTETYLPKIGLMGARTGRRRGHILPAPPAIPVFQRLGWPLAYTPA